MSFWQISGEIVPPSRPEGRRTETSSMSRNVHARTRVGIYTSAPGRQGDALGWSYSTLNPAQDSPIYTTPFAWRRVRDTGTPTGFPSPHLPPGSRPGNPLDISLHCVVPSLSPQHVVSCCGESFTVCFAKQGQMGFLRNEAGAGFYPPPPPQLLGSTDALMGRHWGKGRKEGD